MAIKLELGNLLTSTGALLIPLDGATEGLEGRLGRLLARKAPEVWEWFREQRRRIEVFPLPKYSPEFNAQERLWQYTRREATHNRYFANPSELRSSLVGTFADMKRHPEYLVGLLKPFF